MDKVIKIYGWLDLVINEKMQFSTCKKDIFWLKHEIRINRLQWASKLHSSSGREKKLLSMYYSSKSIFNYSLWTDSRIHTLRRDVSFLSGSEIVSQFKHCASQSHSYGRRIFPTAMPHGGFFHFFTEEGYYGKTSNVDGMRNNRATTKASRKLPKWSLERRFIQRFNVAVKDIAR